MMIKGSGNGGPPSKNGGSDKADEGPQVELVLCDRLDALERALGTVRRRQMTLTIQSLARRGDAELVLTVRADPGKPLPERWLAELAALVDVRQVNVAGGR
jgi:hypothetical protein